MVEEENYVPAIDEAELKEGTMKPVRLEGIPVLFITEMENLRY